MLNMAGEIIRKGDPTSHNGVVLEGSVTDICMGKPIAYIGHKVQCPKCKGTFPIVEGAPTTTFYGKGVALAGMKTSCGATLIATQFTDIVELGGGTAPAAPKERGTEGAASAPTAPAGQPQFAAMPAATSSEDPAAFDEQFRFLDDDGLPLAKLPYSVKFSSGEVVEGITDDDGRTERYVTDGAQMIEIFVGHHQV